MIHTLGSLQKAFAIVLAADAQRASAEAASRDVMKMIQDCKAEAQFILHWLVADVRCSEPALQQLIAEA